MNVSTPRILALTLALACTAHVSAQGGTAVYELKFTSTWSRATHPVDFPSNPHYSSLIGGTHNSKVRFWQVGQVASPGIEQMAETGSTFTLSNEVTRAINAGNADRVWNLGGLGTSPGSRTVRFTATAEFSRLTLVTMLAPSPDWFLGVDSLELLRKGKWVDNLVVPLHVYDAGSDSGTTYLSPNKDTQPKEKIARVTTASGPFKGLPGPIGSYTLRRVASTLVYGCGVNPAGSMSVGGAPLIGGGTTITYSDPTRALQRGGPTAIVFSGAADPAFPCGTKIPGLGLGKAGATGELLLRAPMIALPGATWNGTPLSFRVNVPNMASLIGGTAYVQAVLADNSRAGLTDAVELLVGR